MLHIPPISINFGLSNSLFSCLFIFFCFQPQTAVYLIENFLGAEEFCDEDVQLFEELKKCFESNNFAGVIERQIEILGKSENFVNSSLKSREDICMET